MTPEERLSELGLKLPATPAPAGNYAPVVRTGNLLYCAGTLPVLDGQVTHTGKVGQEQTVQTGCEAACIALLNTLANVQAEIGSLSKVMRVVMLTGYVNSVPGFSESPAVVNGASDLLVAVLGEAGKHARAAVGVSGLPRNATVEVQLIIEVAD